MRSLEHDTVLTLKLGEAEVEVAARVKYHADTFFVRIDRILVEVEPDSWVPAPLIHDLVNDSARLYDELRRHAGDGFVAGRVTASMMRREPG